MNVPYEFDEARREEYQLQLQGAPSRPLEYRLSGLNMDINFGAPERHPSAGGLIVLARGNGKHLLPGETQTAQDVVVEDGACWHETDFQNWVKGFTQQTEITFEMGPLPVEFQIAVIRAGWEVWYGIVKAEVMERIAERKADNEMIPMLDAMVQVDREARAAWEAWQAAVKEEIQEMMEEYADEPEEPDRHDGAVEVLATWLLPVPSLYELYGQGVDHGGPGPSRLTLTRVTDDGLRRAETGTTRKGEHDEAEERLQAGRTGRPGRCDRLGEGHETRRPHQREAGRPDHAAEGCPDHRPDLCPRRGCQHGRPAVLRRRSDPGAAPARDHGGRQAGPPPRWRKAQGKEGPHMKKKPVAGFRCYICGEVFPDQTERATPCGYERFGQATCKGCCEKCHKLEPFPCPQYNTRKRRERREAEKHDLERGPGRIREE